MYIPLIIHIILTSILAHTPNQASRLLSSSPPQCSRPKIITYTSESTMILHLSIINSSYYAFFWQEASGTCFGQTFFRNGTNLTDPFPLFTINATLTSDICDLKSCYLPQNDTLVFLWLDCDGKIFQRSFNSMGQPKTSPLRLLDSNQYEFISLTCLEQNDIFVLAAGASGLDTRIARYSKNGTLLGSSPTDITNAREATLDSWEGGFLITYRKTDDKQYLARYDPSLVMNGSVILVSSNKSDEGIVRRIYTNLNLNLTAVCFKQEDEKALECSIIRDDATILSVMIFNNTGDFYYMLPLGLSRFVLVTIDESAATISRKVFDVFLNKVIDETFEDLVGNFVALGYFNDGNYILGFGKDVGSGFNLQYVQFDSNNERKYAKLLCSGSKYFPTCLSNGSCGCETDDHCVAKMVCISGSCAAKVFFQNISISNTCSPLEITASLMTTINTNSGYTYEWTVNSTKASASRLNQIRSVLNSQNFLNISIPVGLMEEYVDYSFIIRVINPNGVVMENFTSVELDSLEFTGSFLGDFSRKLDNSISQSISISKTFSRCSSNSFNALLNYQWVHVSEFYFDPNDYINSSDPYSLAIPACSLSQFDTSLIGLNLWFINNPTKFYNLTLNLSFSENFAVEILPKIDSISFQSDFFISAFLSSGCTLSNLTTDYVWSCQECLMGSCNQCSDLNNLFGLKGPNATLLIPSNYFPSNSTVTIKVNVTKGNSFALATHTYFISPHQTIALQLKSTPDVYYQSNQDYSIFAFPPNLDNYTWSSIPPIPNFVFKNQIKLLKNDLIPNGISSILLEIVATNATHTGYVSISIPINLPPTNGTLEISPQIGASLSTPFTLSALFWTDPDLPLSYQFSYTVDRGESYKNLQENFVSSNTLVTSLPAFADHSYITVRAVVQDFYAASSEITAPVNVYSQSGNFRSAISTISSKLDSIVSSELDPIAQKAQLAILFSELTSWENQYTLASGSLMTSNGCPQCSGNGECPKDRCVCRPGWSYLDCSLAESIFNYLINIKLKALTQLQGIVTSKNSINDSLLSTTLRTITDNPDFNTVDTYSKVQNILESYLNVSSSEAVLSLLQTQDVGEILDDMLQFASYFDCRSMDKFSQNLIEKAPAYLQTISRSLSATQIPAQNATIETKDSYELFVQKISVCDLLSKSVKISPLEPKIILNLKNTSVTDCSQIVNLQIFALDANLMSCNLSSPKAYTKIALQVLDESNGKPLNLNMQTILEFPPELPLNCDLDSCAIKGNSCFCEDMSLFDVRNQIKAIFASSKLSSIPNIKALLSYNLIDSIPFWILVGLLAWLAITATFLSYKLLRYDAFSKYIKSQRKTAIKLLGLIFSTIHPMIGLYVVNDEEISKRLKAYIYYLRTLVLLVFATMFNSGDDSEDNIFTVSLQFQGINPYSILLPYFTIVPIFKIVDWILHYPSSSYLARCSSRMAHLYRIKFGFGIFFSSLIGIFSNFAVMTIMASSNSSEIRGWIINFIRAMAQDMLLTPSIGIFAQFLLLKILRLHVMKRRRIIRRILEFYREPVLEKLLNSNQVVPIETTEATSPSITKLTLKKAGSFDFMESPLASLQTESGSPQKFDSKKKIFTFMKPIKMKSFPSSLAIYPEIASKEFNQ